MKGGMFPASSVGKSKEIKSPLILMRRNQKLLCIWSITEAESFTKQLTSSEMLKEISKAFENDCNHPLNERVDRFKIFRDVR